MYADASDYAIGAEISQLDNNGKRRPVLVLLAKIITSGNELHDSGQRDVSDSADYEEV